MILGVRIHEDKRIPVELYNFRIDKVDTPLSILFPYDEPFFRPAPPHCSLPTLFLNTRNQKKEKKKDRNAKENNPPLLRGRGQQEKRLEELK